MNIRTHGSILLGRAKWIYLIFSHQIFFLAAFTLNEPKQNGIDFHMSDILWIKVNRFEDVRQFIDTVNRMPGY